MTPHNSGPSLFTDTKPNQAVLEHVTSPDIIGIAHADGERVLRRDNNDSADEDDLEKEDRSLNKFGALLKKYIPFTKGWKQSREIDKMSLTFPKMPCY
ncbi:hypothetical protein GQ600_12634 [Phytophthora cactorum]|nr:hypothetical protein GQ600_12634 [Phytophthora cactorum]